MKCLPFSFCPNKQDKEVEAWVEQETPTETKHLKSIQNTMETLNWLRLLSVWVFQLALSEVGKVKTNRCV